MKKIVLLVHTLVLSMTVNAQVFSGIDAFKRIIEYEGQRYLMEEVFQVKADGVDQLIIDKTIQETDYNEGFMFVLSSYKFNEKKGAIFTSFNSTNFQQTQKNFRNVNLTDEEVKKLNILLQKLSKSFGGYDRHALSKFNEEIIVDVESTYNGKMLTLWIYGNRHTFSESKWDRAMKRHEVF
jgi:hypothetical protein